MPLLTMELRPEASDNPSDNAPRQRQTSATQPDTDILLTSGNPTKPMPSDETGMHGKEKVYGSIP